jgi:hypothetical protein
MREIKHELISKENARIIREQQCEDLNLELRFFFKTFMLVEIQVLYTGVIFIIPNHDSTSKQEDYTSKGVSSS